MWFEAEQSLIVIDYRRGVYLLHWLVSETNQLGLKIFYLAFLEMTDDVLCFFVELSR